MTASLKTTVLDDILTWSNKLPIWQRDALRRVITCETIEDMQIRELAAICRRSHRLAVDESTPSPKPLSPTDVPGAAAKSREITLRSVSAVENVNALCGKQELKFGPNGITIVFGYNGSGKSGYGRILKRACRARRKGAIIPNVLAASAASSPPSAEFCYALDGAEQAPEQWVDGVRDIPALSAVSFFDAECAIAHVGEKNDIAFSPFGLDVLPKLGDLIQKVRSILEHEKSAETSAGLAFLRDRTTRPHTRTGKFLSSLSPDTDVALLADLAGLDEQEVTELAELRTALANDPVKVAQSLRNRASRIAQLQDIIAEAWDALNDDGMKRLHTLATAAANTLAAANVAASGRFATEPIPEVGDAVWRVLWESARTYSLRAFPGRQFPSTGDGARCVLCQQLLDDDAKRRFNNFEQFICDDTSKQAADAKASLDLNQAKFLTFVVFGGRRGRGGLRTWPLVGGIGEGRVGVCRGRLSFWSADRCVVAADRSIRTPASGTIS